MHLDCQCGETIDAADLERLGDVFLAHVRSAHADWPYSDRAVRNYAEATQRLTGPSERLEALGAVTIHRVTPERLDDWASFFDHDAFVGSPEWAACYCIEPHLHDPAAAAPEDVDDRSGAENRRLMRERLERGGATGYLAYVDGRPAGWVNASKRSEYALYRLAAGDVPDADVVGLSCFVIAPPYRRHGLAGQLLDRVIADAPARGVTWIEAYPFVAPADAGKDFRGPRSLYEARGFEVVRERERDLVMRRPVGRPGTP
jgi:GNAT superfamily N-acetyltransferase